MSDFTANSAFERFDTLSSDKTLRLGPAAGAASAFRVQTLQPAPPQRVAGAALLDTNVFLSFSHSAGFERGSLEGALFASLGWSSAYVIEGQSAAEDPTTMFRGPRYSRPTVISRIERALLETRIADLNEIYDVDELESLRSIATDSEVFGTLLQGRALLSSFFESRQRPRLRVISNPETSDATIQVLIPVDAATSREDALRSLEAFDEAWWMNLPEHVRSLVATDVALP